MTPNYELSPLLATIVRNPDLHARWLNTFSFLEYVGFRKIIKSQKAEDLSLDTLLHANEEGRHALLLKKLALRVGGKAYDNYHAKSLLCGTQAEDYFQLLDRACEASLQAALPDQDVSHLTYLYVTWLVEVRALSVYGLYLEALAEIGQESNLKGLLAEETRHLEHVETELLQKDPDATTRRAALQKIEDQLYQNYVQALAHELQDSSRILQDAAH